MKVKVLHRPLGPKKRMGRPDSPNAECWRTYINTVFYFQFHFKGRPTGHWTDWPTPNREFKNYSKMLYGTTSMTSFQSIFQLSTASFSLVHITVLLQIFRDITKQFSEILESSKPRWDGTTTQWSSEVAKLCFLESYDRSQLFDHLSPSTRQ